MIDKRLYYIPQLLTCAALDPDNPILDDCEIYVYCHAIAGNLVTIHCRKQLITPHAFAAIRGYFPIAR